MDYTLQTNVNKLFIPDSEKRTKKNILLLIGNRNLNETDGIGKNLCGPKML